LRNSLRLNKGFKPLVRIAQSLNCISPKQVYNGCESNYGEVRGMAKMYPEWVDTNEIDSPYEPQLFELFKQHLSDKYVVFYSVRLQKPRPPHKGGIEDVEVDFVIAHPQYGLLCLEAKGGHLEVDGRTGKWRNRNNGKVLDESPFKQSHNACYALLAWIHSRPETKGIRYPTWWAVALPSVDVEANEEIEAGQPRAIVLDKGDLLAERIAGAMERIFQHYERKDGKSQPGAKGIRALETAMARSWFLRSYMATDFEHEEEAIKQLTNGQFKLLRQMESNSRILISGCAGSGKTMLAVEKATRLVSGGAKVLLTCYNVNLAQDLRRRVPEQANLTIESFHHFAEIYAEAAGVKIAREFEPDQTPPPAFFQTILPEALLEATNKGAEKFDAIIVDEGQDFKSGYWTPLQLLLKDPDGGIFYIFCDDNQRIYSQDVLPFMQPHFHLGENLRNVRPIGLLVGNYHSGRGYYEAAGPEAHDRRPQVVMTAKYGDKTEALEEVLDDLTGEKIPADHIIILTPLGKRTSHWKEGLTVGRFTLTRGIQARQPNQIAVETIQAFKGLERPVVILTELDRWLPEERDEMLYIALSRARNHLVIFDELPAPKKPGATPAPS